MDKKKVLACLIIGVSLIGCVIYGINTKKCWKDDVQLRDYTSNPKMEVSFEDMQPSDTFKEPSQIRTFKGLYDTADVIARVRVNKDGRRERYEGCIVSEAEVIETYKGTVDENLIDIIEPVRIVEVQNNKMDSLMGYMLMEDDSEYILFLYKRDYRGYGKKNVYIPTTTTLSKYKYDANNNSIIGKAFLSLNMYEGQEIPYSLYSKYDAITEDKNVVDFYNSNAVEINRLLKEGSN